MLLYEHITQAREHPMLARDNIQDINFKSESHHYSVTCDIIHKFWQNSSVQELVSVRFDLDTKLSELAMFHKIKQICTQQLKQVSGNFVRSSDFYVQCGNRMLITARNTSYRNARNNIREYEFEVMGAESDVVAFQTTLEDALNDQKLVKISWYYRTNRGTDSASLHVTSLNQHVRDEFYPWLKPNVSEFIRSYFESPASVLVLYGPPGTGKTSFLRHLLLTQGINAAVTYDDKVLSNDEFFVNYLTDDEHDALIVEDADVFLAPREDGENTMMSKFLNVSDGLIKIMNKKMIFTTNITQLNRIDAALLRPGRCFEAVEFRELTPTEAGAAAHAAGAAQQDWSTQQAWSLAQIFNSSDQPMPSQRFRIGFG